MRKWFTGVAAALLVAGWVWAQTAYNAPGGLPSSPRFQSVTAISSGGGGTGSHPAFLAQSLVPAFVWNSSGGGTDQHNAQCYYQGGVPVLNCSFLNDAGAAQSNWLSVSRGAGTAVSQVAIGNSTDNPAITINGAALITRATGQVAFSGTTCSVTSISGLGFNASCTHSATGTYVLTFATAFSASPACTVTGTSYSTNYFPAVSALSTSGLTITTYNTSGSAADEVTTAYVVCVR